jgi:translation initiation factor 1 (eIF-1/SUI1)
MVSFFKELEKMPMEELLRLIKHTAEGALSTNRAVSESARELLCDLAIVYNTRHSGKTVDEMTGFVDELVENEKLIKVLKN